MREAKVPESAFNTLLGRALNDIDFRRQIVGVKGSKADDLAPARRRALQEVLGQAPSPEQMKAFNAAVEAVRDFSEFFGFDIDEVAG